MAGLHHTVFFPSILVYALAAAAAGALAQEKDGASEGKQIFTSAQPPCALCHTLEDAGASGRVGPNLDQLQPTEEQVRLVVRSGAGSMPAYGDQLSDAEIDAVAEYVAGAAGQ